MKSLRTSGKWIDIISMSCYDEKSDGKAFNWIVCELFPRKIQPEYAEPESQSPEDLQAAREYNRYLTWKTAHQDIHAQRLEGYNGSKYLILCKLRNKNKGKTITFILSKIVKIFYGPGEETREISENPQNIETFTEPMKPDWEYKITFLKKLTDKQAKYIKSHESEIMQKIPANGNVTPEIMSIKENNNDRQKHNHSESRQVKGVDVSTKS